MKRRIALLPLLLAFSSVLYAQPSLEGTWQLSLAPPGQEIMTFDVKATYADDALALALTTAEGELALAEIRHEEEMLHFVIPSGHGTITCALYAQGEDAFTGTCGGPMGEAPTTLKRRIPDES